MGRVQRRQFLIGTVVLVTPLQLLAQAVRVPRIGYLLLVPLVDPPSRERQAFLDGMRELGHVPGKTVEIVYGSAEGEPDFIGDACQTLLRQKVELIVASGPTATLASKRDIGPAAANRQVDSPISMTSPMTTLTRGQYAPLLHRSSAAPYSTLPQRSHAVFLRRDLRHRADYFANPALRRFDRKQT